MRNTIELRALLRICRNPHRIGGSAAWVRASTSVASGRAQRCGVGWPANGRTLTTTARIRRTMHWSRRAYLTRRIPTTGVQTRRASARPLCIPRTQSSTSASICVRAWDEAKTEQKKSSLGCSRTLANAAPRVCRAPVRRRVPHRRGPSVSGTCRRDAGRGALRAASSTSGLSRRGPRHDRDRGHVRPRGRHHRRGRRAHRCGRPRRGRARARRRRAPNRGPRPLVR